jgi:hypothetical protein
MYWESGLLVRGVDGGFPEVGGGPYNLDALSISQPMF